MHPSLEKARRFEDLLALEQQDTPYVFSGIFNDKGLRARQLSKKKFKLLRHIDGDLRPMLGGEERVYFLTFGSNVSFWESYFVGWAMYYLNRRAIVLTNFRILLLQIDSKGRPRDLRSQLDYRAIMSIKRSGLGNTKVRVKSGKSYLFTRLPRADRKVLQKLVERVRGEMGDSESAALEMEELCPHCYKPVAGRPTGCPLCGRAFKSARRAGLLSLVFPGLGDIYVGHRKLAVLEILAASLIWLAFLLPDPEFQRSLSDMFVGAVFIVVFVHSGDALATWYVARKGHYPARSRAVLPRHAT